MQSSMSPLAKHHLPAYPQPLHSNHHPLLTPSCTLQITFLSSFPNLRLHLRFHPRFLVSAIRRPLPHWLEPRSQTSALGTDENSSPHLHEIVADEIWHRRGKTSNRNRKREKERKGKNDTRCGSAGKQEYWKYRGAYCLVTVWIDRLEPL